MKSDIIMQPHMVKQFKELLVTPEPNAVSAELEVKIQYPTLGSEEKNVTFKEPEHWITDA